MISVHLQAHTQDEQIVSWLKVMVHSSIELRVKGWAHTDVIVNALGINEL